MRSVVLTVVVVAVLAGVTALQFQEPKWKAAVAELVPQAQQAGLNPEAWGIVIQKAEESLPPVYPFSSVRGVALAAQTIAQEVQNLREISLGQGSEVPRKTIENIFKRVGHVESSLREIYSKIAGVPDFFLNKEQKSKRDRLLTQLVFGLDVLKEMGKVREVLERFMEDEETVLILLQNENEPRPTGGFAGSLILLRFGDWGLRWEFLDTYALDREVPAQVQAPAPAYFYNLSKTISLRDANFWRDFPTTAGRYRMFLDAAGKQKPATVIAINLSSVRELLRMVGPVTLDKWGVELNADNFDLVLGFLVEGKVSGRFAVKEPVLEFARKLFSAEVLRRVPLASWKNFPLQNLIEEKNILAHSTDQKLQRLFRHWGVSGELKQDEKADNFLSFDFVSTGANKTEKFLWTRITHDSYVTQSGGIKNTLKIKRTHALQGGELDKVLGLSQWPQNVQDLMTPDLRWKLAEGQNRTVVRVYVPADAQLKRANSPSGEITESLADGGAFKIFEVPMYVLPGETAVAQLQYTTHTRSWKGSARTYHLQLVGTPARRQTSFLSSISTPPQGKFRADTLNIGRPQDLVDSDFRAVLEFSP